MHDVSIELRGAVPSYWKLRFQTGCGDVPYPAGVCLDFDDAETKKSGVPNGGVISIEEAQKVRDALDQHIKVLEAVGIVNTQQLTGIQPALKACGFSQSLWLKNDRELAIRDRTGTCIFITKHFDEIFEFLVHKRATTGRFSTGEKL